MAGDADGARRQEWQEWQEWQDGGKFAAPLRAKGRQMERGVARGGESEAKAFSRSRTQPGASEARWGCGDYGAERPIRERASENTLRTQNAPAAGRLVRNARAGPLGQPLAMRAWELPSSGARLAHGQPGEAAALARA